MKRPTISLHGSYFCINYGDILLIKIFYEWIKNAYPKYDICMPLLDTKLIKELPECKRGIINFLKSDLLIFCGGGYFGEKPSHKQYWAFRNFFRHGLLGLIAFIFHIPYAIIGVETGPITAKWFRKVVVFICKRAKVVIVRNEESKDFLTKNGVEGVSNSLDAVLSLSEIVPIKNIEDTKKIIAIHIAEILQHKQQYLEFCKNLIDVLKEDSIDVQIKFIFDNPINDRIHHYEDLFSLFSDAKISYEILLYTDHETTIREINESTHVITTKLHVGITGAALNKPVLSLYIHPKTIRLHKQIGNLEYCFPVKDAGQITKVKIRDFFKRTFVLPEENLQGALKNKYALYNFIKKYSSVVSYG